MIFVDFFFEGLAQIKVLYRNNHLVTRKNGWGIEVTNSIQEKV